MKMWLGLLVFLVLFCFSFSVAFGYPNGCAGSRGVCESVQNGGIHVCPKCGRHVVPDGNGMFNMVPASQCWRPECVAARKSSNRGSDNNSSGSTYDPYAAQRAAEKAAADERARLKRLEEAHKKKLREDAAKRRKTWDKNDV